MKKKCLVILCFFFLVACEKDELYSAEPITSSVQPVEYVHSVSSNEVLERAYQMATMEWTPVRKIPKRGGGYYEEGLTVKGTPYSSVKEINTYLFQDVSYHTFMTAVHNPNSVLYTEDISKTPYHGLNCAPYYGSVCSSAVMWALGIDIPYYANQIVELPFVHKLESQELDSLKVCDLLWKSGHVQMVYDVEHRSDTLYQVKLFEQSGKSAYISTYSKNSFRSLWEKGGYVAYRYEYLNYSDELTTYNDLPSVIYNEDLCPSKGDKAVYRTDDTIRVNIFNPDYGEIVLQKDGLVVSTEQYEGNLYQFSNLKAGIYDVFLQKGERRSDPMSFEVVETDVEFSFGSEGNIVIYFNSSAVADYVALCKLEGGSRYYPISAQDRNNGYIVVPAWDYPEYYCKVVFKGEYGTIINRPIRVR